MNIKSVLRKILNDESLNDYQKREMIKRVFSTDDSGYDLDGNGDKRSDKESTKRDPRDGSTGDPRDGSTGDPRDGSTGDPRDGSTGDPRDGSTGDPRDGSTGDPRDGSTGDPRDGSTGDPRDGSTGDPRDEMVDPKDIPDPWERYSEDSYGEGGEGGEESEDAADDDEIDEYSRGNEVGMYFANMTYKHGGIEPSWIVNTYELPIVKKMVILKESMLCESVDDDVIDRIIKSSASTKEKIKQLISSRYGSLDDIDYIDPPHDNDDIMGNDHVISKDESDKLKKEIRDSRYKPNKEDVEFDKDKTVSIDLIRNIKNDAYDAMSEKDKRIIEETERTVTRKIAMAGKGIVNWKVELSRYMKSFTDVAKTGRMSMAKYMNDDIFSRTWEDKEGINKCVIYIDTSGSINNSSTQLIPLMINDIQTIAKECGFNYIDIHLYHHRVYSSFYNLTCSTVADDKFFLGAEYGDNDFREVYNDIVTKYITHTATLKHYETNKPIKDNKVKVDCVIIITDYDFLRPYYHGKITPEWQSKLKPLLSRMLFIVYSNNSSVYKGELDNSLKKLVSNKCRFIGIGLEDFVRQIEHNNKKKK